MGDDCCGPDGHAHGDAAAEGDADHMHPTEAAALRGFLSGIYATRLDPDELQAYLDAMGDDHSAFGKPARFLAEQMRALVATVDLPEDEPPAWQLLQAVSQEAEEENVEDGEGEEE
ncbi:MAG: hypothetical protein QOD77_576 [Thermoplasmata archaeon]|jgi:hypothetical protein|nr:hypothetical protein [Thermoplasmata archaeon]